MLLACLILQKYCTLLCFDYLQPYLVDNHHCPSINLDSLSNYIKLYDYSYDCDFICAFIGGFNPETTTPKCSHLPK